MRVRREGRDSSHDVATCGRSERGVDASDVPDEGASKVNVGGGVAEPATTYTRFNVGLHSGLSTLRDLPVVHAVRPPHPLRVYLEERGVGIARGAEMLGMSERTLREALAWRRRFEPWREQMIASGLGVDRALLFPIVDHSRKDFPSTSHDGE